MYQPQAQAYMPMGGVYPIDRSVALHGVPQGLADVFLSCLPQKHYSRAYTAVEFIVPIPVELKLLAATAAQHDFVDNPEGYIIKAEHPTVQIYADSQSGLFCGAMALAQRRLEDGLEECLEWDYPQVPMRGVKIYIPPRDRIDEFKRIIDMMVFFRMNTLMLEIGGAMEYKRHPEINEGWEEYCQKTKAYPGGTEGIQDFIYPWRKNSIHNENGGGSYLTQAELAELIEYITARNIEIIPECPSTSHCDYMLTRHRELAEHPEDEYADTFCTEEPRAYELLFELLDETIALFKPRILNIGHDEYYSFGTCPRCRHKHPVDIFTDDVTRIHDFLASRGVRTMMWSDKLMNVADRNGYGGAANYSYKAWNSEWDYFGVIPATWPARDRLPKDILCLNWYWSMGKKFDKPYRDLGYEVVFGNFAGTGMLHWRDRLADNILGGIVSNWSTADEVYMQRNGVLLEMAYDAQLYWDRKADHENLDWLAPRCFDLLYRWKTRDLGDANPDGMGKAICVLHNSDITVPYQLFNDGVFIDWSRYDLGHYRATYEDGTTAELPVKQGLNIGYADEVWYPKTPADPEQTRGLSSHLREVAYSTLPIRHSMQTYYQTVYDNPHPDKKLVSLQFVPNPGFVYQEQTEQNQKDFGVYVPAQNNQGVTRVPQVNLLGFEVLE